MNSSHNQHQTTKYFTPNFFPAQNPMRRNISNWGRSYSWYVKPHPVSSFDKKRLQSLPFLSCAPAILAARCRSPTRFHRSFFTDFLVWGKGRDGSQSTLDKLKEMYFFFALRFLYGISSSRDLSGFAHAKTETTSMTKNGKNCETEDFYLYLLQNWDILVKSELKLIEIEEWHTCMKKIDQNIHHSLPLVSRPPRDLTMKFIWRALSRTPSTRWQIDSKPTNRNVQSLWRLGTRCSSR